MQYNLKHTQILEQSSDCLVVGVFTDRHFSAAARALNDLTDGYLTQLVESADLNGELLELILLRDLPKLPSKRLLVVGCGSVAEFNETAYLKVIDKAVRFLQTTGARDACLYLTDLEVPERDLAWKIQQAVQRSWAALYSFSHYKTKTNPAAMHLTELLFNVADPTEFAKAQIALSRGLAIASGVRFAQDLSNTPANVCTPTFLAQQAQSLAADFDAVRAEILTEAAMRELGMHALLAVAQGSEEPAQLIVLHYRGGAANAAPHVLIGKGVTFDTGGISLKPPMNMLEMKYDMCGAASVLGTIKAVAALNLPINLIGIIPAVENMPSGRAVKPGDVVKSMSGQTIEILNTDAEGRLILCDALTYAEQFKPAAVIDIATLTGAIILTLGSVASGLFANDKILEEAVCKAAQESWDRVWPLPIWSDYQELLNDSCADMSNISQSNDAKSIVAACFLARFATQYPWAHLDIAGTAYKSGKADVATGRPVNLLVQYLINQVDYQSKLS